MELGPVCVFMSITGDLQQSVCFYEIYPSPTLARWNRNVLRECMRIKKMRSKFRFLKRVEIKMTQLVFLLIRLLFVRL